MNRMKNSGTKVEVNGDETNEAILIVNTRTEAIGTHCNTEAILTVGSGDSWWQTW